VYTYDSKKKTPVISLRNINWLAFMTKTDCVWDKLAGFKTVELVKNIWENKIYFYLYITVITAHT